MCASARVYREASFFFQCIWEMLIIIAFLNVPIILSSCPLGFIHPMAWNIHGYKYAYIEVHLSPSLCRHFLRKKNLVGFDEDVPKGSSMACGALGAAGQCESRPPGSVLH